MRYLFKILVLGNPDLSIPYCSNVFHEMGEDEDTFIKWEQKFNVLEDVCDLEIDGITNLAADFDEIIPSVDGIIYFLNPLDQEELELFQLIYDILDKVKRNIPTILMFNNEEGLLPVLSNNLLKESWIKYPNFESFVNHRPSDFHQVIHCLCISMITGDTPLSIETAWLRLPILIEQANQHYLKRNYYEAAQITKKVAFISKIFNREDYFIVSEQSAFLYSKINLFLEAARMLEEVDSKKAYRYKKLYAEAMIREGNKLFNKGDYEFAARQYENAAHWCLIELKDKDVIIKSFKLAINSWISACKVENAFTILERLPHDDILPTLKSLTEKVIAAMEYLASQGNLEGAREELYIAIHTYQREGLFDEMEHFTNKLNDILIKILEDKIQKDKPYDARATYDEIENLWEAFDAPKQDLDDYLGELIKLFLERSDFGMSSYLLNELNSLELKKKLTEHTSEVEEKNKELRKKQLELNIKKGVEIINSFYRMEEDMISNENNNIIKVANEFIEARDYQSSQNVLIERGDFLKNIGKYSSADDIYCKVLNVVVESINIEEFFPIYNKLTEKETKRGYLEQVFPYYLESLKKAKATKNFEEKKLIFSKSNIIYRDQMLYEESRVISREFINVIKDEALRVLQVQQNKNGIETAIELIKEAKNISTAYLESVELDFDEIYKEIAEIYIKIEDLSSALEYIDKIEDKVYKKGIYDLLAEEEDRKREAVSQKVKDSLKIESLRERLSIIKKRAEDAALEKDYQLKQRIGLKRVYFKESLKTINEENYKEAIEKYSELIDKLNKIQKYYLAGVSLNIVLMLLYNTGQKKRIIELLEKKSDTESFFSETFPVVLSNYIADLIKIEQDEKIIEALSFMKNLPLFDEELHLLNDIIGIDKPKEDHIQDYQAEATIDLEELNIMINRFSERIEKENKDVSKRKLMKRQYWEGALQLLEKNKYEKSREEYLKTLSSLVSKNFYKHASIALIISLLTLLYEANIEEANDSFNRYTAKFQALNQFPEIKLIKKLLIIYQKKLHKSKGEILKILLDKLILFDEEKQFINTLLEQTVPKESESESKVISEVNPIVINKINQKIDILRQKYRDHKLEFEQLFKRRKAFKKRYFENVLQLLNTERFKEAATKYSEIAEVFSKRSDHKNSTLMKLLQCLANLKAGESPEFLLDNIKQFLENLGVSKNLIGSTFNIELIKFILEVKKYNIKKYDNELNKMLNELPIFEEEKTILTI
ncbi:MAG: hypothetical protein GF317_05415 [Candidatus Lokiarchaeota archaeon]|nr:hypothetical protein [Candidatus Lokiarchaeota archaeon]MBD3199246.1 hypothetical protein [Candidatus Lokiarchaeota archaeon]